MTRIALITTLCLGLLCSCDVPGIIEWKNNTSSTMTIDIYRHSSLSNTVEIQSGSIESNVYGFGIKWSDVYIKEFSKGIDSIIVTSDEGILRLENDDISQLFLEADRNVLRKRLRITLASTNFVALP